MALEVSHLSISVSDLTRSKSFYDGLFDHLGWKALHDGSGELGYSNGTFDIWLVQAEETGEHAFRAPGYHHFAFRADQKEDVDTAFEWCKENHVDIVDQPASYPEYSSDYYAVFFLDLDGLKLEVAYYS